MAYTPIYQRQSISLAIWRTFTLEINAFTRNRCPAYDISFFSSAFQQRMADIIFTFDYGARRLRGAIGLEATSYADDGKSSQDSGHHKSSRKIALFIARLHACMNILWYHTTRGDIFVGHHDAAICTWSLIMASWPRLHFNVGSITVRFCVMRWRPFHTSSPN